MRKPVMDERRIRLVYVWSLVLKGVDALAETVGGLILYFVSTDMILSLVRTLTLHELTQDPNDVIANWLMHMAAGLSIGTKSFYALYLVSHGAIKLVMVAGLLADRRWAYPLALAGMGAFIVYQLYRFSFTHAPALIVLTVFDLIVIGLVWHEWHVRRRPGRPAPSRRLRRRDGR